MPDTGIVIGVDAGGTHTRALCAGADGEARGTGQGGGGNPVSNGVAAAVEHATDAVRAALAGTDPAAVAHVLVGQAGYGTAAGREVAETLPVRWAELGLSAPVTVVTDIEVAYAAGSPDPDGVLVLSGTGAVAAEIRAGTRVRQADGHGWLVGDEGSGFWLGREAVRAVLAALDGRGPETALTKPVAAALDAEPTTKSLVPAVYAGAPIRLAALAPLVSEAAAGGDPVAAGSVLLSPGPVAAAVRAGLRERFGLDVRDAGHGAGGAAALALYRHTGAPVTEEVHRRLTSC
jgi:N-acetylglucosamine kinase-like BadF-type ATPase